MPPQVKAYQTDVTTMSSVELELLSTEIEESVNVSESDECGLPWDDEASARYWEMHRELRRRWEIKFPEEAARQREILKNIVPYFLESIKASLAVAREASRDFEFCSGRKIGDVINVRKPQRFHGVS